MNEDIKNENLEDIKETVTTEVVEEPTPQVEVTEAVQEPTPEVPVQEEAPEVSKAPAFVAATDEAPTETIIQPEAPKNQKPRFDKNKKFGNKRDNRKNFEQKKKLLEEKVISISRVTKVTKGGRHFRFSAAMVVGDMKGLVGIGTGKSNEVPEAIKKGIQAANKNLVKISLIDGRTIPHEAIGVCGRAKVLIKPAAAGTGIIAGGAARAVLELAGVKDVVSKSLGSNTHVNVAKATLAALVSQRTPERVAALRGKSVEEL